MNTGSFGSSGAEAAGSAGSAAGSAAGGAGGRLGTYAGWEAEPEESGPRAEAARPGERLRTAAA